MAGAPRRRTLGLVSPDDQLRQGGSGVVYALARVRSPVYRTVALKAWCAESFRVTVNARDAVVADRERDTIGDATWGTARLAAGWNRILVKVTGSDAFALRLCDPTTGFPLGDLEVGDPLEGLTEALPPAQEPTRGPTARRSSARSRTPMPCARARPPAIAPRASRSRR